jgi:hypothetical protein
MYFKIWQKTLITRKCLSEAKNKTNACIGLRKWGKQNFKGKKNPKLKEEFTKFQ